ncbi:MAG: hypothetical protein AAF720_15080 [Pseudomonadota bacterium]
MKCILHIGTHKTGSTAIQSALSTYDDGRSFYAQLGNANHSVPLYTAFSENFLDYHIWKKQGAREHEIREKRHLALRDLQQQLARRSREQIILSGEDISLLSENEALSLLDLIRTHCDDIIVIAYVRDPLSFAASSFQEFVQGGMGTIPEMMSPRYRFRLEKFENNLGKDKLIVKCYSPASLMDGDIVKDFCATVGLDSGQMTRSHINESVSVHSLKAMYLLNRTNPLQYGDMKLIECRLQLLHILKRVFKDDAKLNRYRFEKLADYTECAWLKKEFNIEFPGTEEQKEPIPSLQEWLNDFPADATEKLIDFLHANGIKENFGMDTVKIINRIYYLTLEGGKLIGDGLELTFKHLMDNDVNMLRDLALKYESGKLVSKDDALALMTLALRGRPHGTLIKQKVFEWGSVKE